MWRGGIAILILLSGLLMAGTFSAPATSSAAIAPPAQQCPAVNVNRDQIPLNVSLFRLEGNRVVPAITVPRDRLPPQFEDCGDPKYLGVTIAGTFYLVRRGEFSSGICSCHTVASRNAGEAAMGSISRCPHCP